MRIIVPGFFLILFSLSCQGQDIKNDIIGHWKAEEEKVEGIENKTIDGNKIKIDFEIIITKSYLDLNENGISHKNLPYKIIKLNKDEFQLLIGNRTYYIEKLNKNSLVLREDSFLSSLIILKKINEK